MQEECVHWLTGGDWGERVAGWRRKRRRRRRRKYYHGGTNERTKTMKDRATQPMEAGRLSSVLPPR